MLDIGISVMQENTSSQTERQIRWMFFFIFYWFIKIVLKKRI